MLPVDISRLLTPGHPNWPGDAQFEVQPGARIAGGDSVNTGVIRTSTHTGTHVDAPWHYDDGGKQLHEIPLDVYVGPALVLRVAADQPIGPGVLEA
ncbi:cyclase family protein [Deinococcus radiophilus]|uniref:cyclase family protein n=1 Tax=Deinococcus radiophilus TaxID=32062 RepID=UPI003618C5CE